MMAVLFQKEKMGRTERKILQLDRFSLLVVPVFYFLTAGIFIALHRTWTSEFKLWTFGDAKLYFSLCFVHIWVKYQGLNIKKTYFLFTILCHLCPGFLAECETFYGEFWQIYDQQPDANWAINVANAFARRRTEILWGALEVTNNAYCRSRSQVDNWPRFWMLNDLETEKTAKRADASELTCLWSWHVDKTRI